MGQRLKKPPPVTVPGEPRPELGKIGSSPAFAYDLVQSNGAVTALGGALYYGSVHGQKLVAPIIALVPTPDRKGYWLIGADASVFGFGDAKNEGSRAARSGPTR